MSFREAADTTDVAADPAGPGDRGSGSQLVARKRPCLICCGVETHPVHGPDHGGLTTRIDGRLVVMVSGERYLRHSYDPGERRRG